MTTITVTVPTGRKGEQAFFKIEFQTSKFNEVIDAVSNIKNIEDLKSSTLWTVK